jgi:hypothetical protein
MLPPRHNSTLKMLEPMALPTAMSECPRRAATREVASSGREVPTATRVMPTSHSLMPRARAMAVAPPTNRCDPSSSSPKPTSAVSASQVRDRGCGAPAPCAGLGGLHGGLAGLGHLPLRPRRVGHPRGVQHPHQHEPRPRRGRHGVAREHERQRQRRGHQHGQLAPSQRAVHPRRPHERREPQDEPEVGDVGPEHVAERHRPAALHRRLNAHHQLGGRTFRRRRR